MGTRCGRCRSRVWGREGSLWCGSDGCGNGGRIGSRRRGEDGDDRFAAVWSGAVVVAAVSFARAALRHVWVFILCVATTLGSR